MIIHSYTALWTSVNFKNVRTEIVPKILHLYQWYFAWGKHFTHKIHTINCIKTGDKLSLYPTKSICKLQKYYLYYITFICLWACRNILFFEEKKFRWDRVFLFVRNMDAPFYFTFILKCAIVHYKCFTNISTKRTYTTYHLLGKIAEYFEIGSLFRGILVDFFRWCFFYAFR